MKEHHSDLKKPENSGEESVSVRHVFDETCTAIACENAALVTSLPRGSLHIIQPARVNLGLLKSYGRGLHLHDRPAWEAIIRKGAVAGKDCWPAGQFQRSTYYTGFLAANGFRDVIAARVDSPVLKGYDGAIELFRAAGQEPFSDNDLEKLQTAAERLSRAIHESHERRAGMPPSAERLPLNHRVPVRQFIFDSSLRPVLPEQDFQRLDASLRQHMLDLARQRFGQVNGDAQMTDRVSLPDARGDLWNFRVVLHRSYPALGDGPFVFFCMQPECSDWAVLRPGDFAADPEIARLVPALKFMQQEFPRGPTLHEIAKTVHLSPFHFHRRFTELLGITPKHLLLDCQIEAAKQQLLARQKELAEIATACGFAHQSHFTSRFKQATGLTPTRWRRLAMQSQR